MAAKPGAAAKALLVLISTLLTLAVLEIALRIVGPAPAPPEDTLRTYTEYDAQLGWRGRPNARGRYNTARFSIEVSLNGGGWRDGEPQPQAGVPQVAVLGDSFTWGYGVERKDRYSDRLAVQLPGWRVQNYGICGYGTDQELMVLRASAMGIAPRIVIVEFAIGNDLDNILSSSAYKLPKPRYTLAQGALRLEGVPVPRTENWDRAARTGLRDFLTAHVRVYAWVRPRWAALRPGLGRLLRLVKNNAADGVRLKVYERQEPERVRKGWKLAEALLAAARDETARAGGRLVLLAVPDRLQVEDALWQQAMEEFHLDPAQYDRDQPDRRLREIAGRLGITLADPLDAQRAKAAGGANLFVPDDPHWNAEGHAIAAEVLRAALRPLVETSPDPMAGAR